MKALKLVVIYAVVYLRVNMLKIMLMSRIMTDVPLVIRGKLDIWC